MPHGNGGILMRLLVVSDIHGREEKLERALDALTAGGGGMWADSLARRRCLVPVRMFYETRRAGARNGGDGGRRPPAAARHVAFALPGGGALFLAGVYQDERFSYCVYGDIDGYILNSNLSWVSGGYNSGSYDSWDSGDTDWDSDWRIVFIMPDTYICHLL